MNNKTVKIWLLLLLCAAPALAYSAGQDGAGNPDRVRGWEASAPGDPNEPEENWLDDSHSYATEQAQALTQWMDQYFGEPNYELEAAESLLRLDFTTDWDEQDGTNNNVRLRGKIQVPRISKRLNLVFSEDEGDELDTGRNEPTRDDGFGLLYRVSEDEHSRFDLTMGINWNRVRPGVRYRYQGALSDVSTYRFTQRLQYDNKNGGFATSQIELNRVLGEHTLLRWNNRAVYGEETRGTEWVTRLSLFQRHKTVSRKRQLGISYFGAVNGVTDPDYVKNYQVGVLFRRQVYRRYLFLEVEPAYNYRKENEDAKRQFGWSVAVRLQIALERDLARNKNRNKNKKKTAPDGEADGQTSEADLPVAPGSDYPTAVDSPETSDDL
ncbi:MAG: hypothetical protein V2I26_12900 [Halieaceae bacterium]|jgi:hypothetical protein|nr:hypothetical protein [Halieaceae bacterium]